MPLSKEAAMKMWRVSSNYVNGRIIFQCYRTIRPDEVDHSGNRETDNLLFDDELDAYARCRELNGSGLGSDPTRMDQHPMSW